MGSQQKNGPVIVRTSEIWEYDGSFNGFMTIVFFAFSKKKFPELILTPQTAVESLFLSEWIATDEAKAEKIQRRLQQKLRSDNWQFIINGFYSSTEQKETSLLEALQIAIYTKDTLLNFIGNPAILALQRGIQALLGEAHQYTGFMRFEYAGSMLFGKFAPKHFSLPYLCPHFAERYPGESILIYDETHRLLALIDHGQISFIEDTDCPDVHSSQTEDAFRAYWRTFLDSVTIHERANYRAQMGHMPLHYRKHMTEFQ